jgi:polysaccharide export outer membrane protein
MFLEPGDIVNIPPADLFFVAGEVNGPGAFPLKEGTTLRQAISLAQGMTFKAVTGRGIIFREDPQTGKRQELQLDVGAVMSGKREDVVILPNDVIIVPNSRMKTAILPFLSAFGVNVAYRLPLPR